MQAGLAGGRGAGQCAGTRAVRRRAATAQGGRAAAVRRANEKAYRIDAARHIYDAYPAQILKGKVPPLVYAILVTETEIDARGKVLNVRVVRPPASAREVTPWVVSMIHRASPLPPPARIGRVKFVEVWLVDKSGQFQVHSLTEGQL